MTKIFKTTLIVISIFLVLSHYFVYTYFVKVPEIQPPENCTEEIKQLSKLINSEADETDTLDMYLVGSTVLNRIDSNDFPSSQDSVVRQQKQFSGYKGRKYERTVLSDTIASRLIRGEFRNYEVLYFYNRKRVTDLTFLNLLRNKKKFITKTKSHVYYGSY